MAQATDVDIGGRRLHLTNLDKVLFTEAQITKAEVLDYYANVAECMLPFLADRPVTFRRAPDGPTGQIFYEKHVPRGAPDWLVSIHVPSGGGRRGATATKTEPAALIQPSIDGLAALMWAANRAAIELHVPMWRIGPRGPRAPDLLVLDLDPGAPSGLPECALVALELRTRLAASGLEAIAKTSGSKGMQLYAKFGRRRDASGYAKSLAESLTRDFPDQVVATMRKDIRGGKVLIDWSQNNPSKTTVAPYSLRLTPTATVSTPVTWEEVAAIGEGELGTDTWTLRTIPQRLRSVGDLFAPLLTGR